MDKLLTIVGATATGKTDIALSLAKKFGAEIISCDSRQVYVGLDIGSGKLPGAEVEYSKHQGYWVMDGVRVWMLDLVSSQEVFSIKDYIVESRKVIRRLWKDGKKVIVVGGSGYYLKGLLEGIGNLAYGANLELREELENKSLGELQELVSSELPHLWSLMNVSDRANTRRLVRKLEVARGQKGEGDDETGALGADVLKIGLNAPREALNRRIDERVDRRMQAGMVDEARLLHQRGLSYKKMEEFGLEYKYLAYIVRGDLVREEFEKVLKTKIHQYAKRQMAWFGKDPDIIWFDISSVGWNGKLESRVADWYNE